MKTIHGAYNNFLLYYKDLLHRNSLMYMWGYKTVPTTNHITHFLLITN